MGAKRRNKRESRCTEANGFNASAGSDVETALAAMREEMAQLEERVEEIKQELDRLKRKGNKLCRCDDDIHDAVRMWHKHRAAAEVHYGDISEWDTSSVTDMSNLFYSEEWRHFSHR